MKWKTTLDALKLCVTKNDELYKQLSQEDLIVFDGFEVFVTHRHTNDKNEVTSLSANIDMGGERFATIYFEANDKYGTFTLFNKTFYDVLTTTPEGERVAIWTCFFHVLETLNLPFHNVTAVDVAIDMNTSMTSNFERMKKDIDNYFMYVNGKKVEGTKRIKGILVQHPTTRISLIRKPTYYIKQKEGEQLTIYDKAAELTEESPEKDEYIRGWNGIKGKTMHRLEVHLKRGRVTAICERLHITHLEFLMKLQSERFRLYILDSLTKSFCFFKSIENANQKKGGRIGILDLLFVAMTHITTGGGSDAPIMHISDEQVLSMKKNRK